MSAVRRLSRWAGGLALVVALLLGGAVVGDWWARHPRGGPAADPGPAEASAPGRKVLYWYDPMEPAQHFEHGGKSPFMDMALVPRYADDPAATPESEVGLSLPAGTVQALGMRVAAVERVAFAARVEAAGTIDLSERDVSIVQARTGGFVERVHAHAPGDVVAAGSALVDVLNPEWAGAQQEFLAVRAMHDAPLAAAARARLLLLGMPEDLVARVEAAGQPIPVSTIVMPASGVLTELSVRPGMTLASGMTLARINGLSTVWLTVAVPEAEAGVLTVGQTVRAELAALPGSALTGKVAAILPQLNAATRTLQVRVELPNPGNRLRPGMFAEVRLSGPARSVLAVPSDAVIRTGTRTLVYVAEEGGRYRPVEVTIGAERDGRLEVRSGLYPGQKVVVSGQFLVDSEASLRGLQPAASPVLAAPPAASPVPAAPPPLSPAPAAPSPASPVPAAGRP